MAIDTNEISGFINGCTNVGYLNDLHNLLKERIATLGGAPTVPLALGTGMKRRNSETPKPDQEIKPLFETHPHVVENRPAVEDRPAEVKPFHGFPVLPESPTGSGVFKGPLPLTQREESLMGELKGKEELSDGEKALLESLEKRKS